MYVTELRAKNKNIAMFLVTSPIVINVPTRGLLAVETMHAIVQWLANLNIKRNMTSMFLNKKHLYTVAGVSDCLLDLCLLNKFLNRSHRNSRINRRKQQRWWFPLLPGKVHDHSSDVAWSDTDLHCMVLRIYDHPISHHNTGISQCAIQTTWSLSVLHLCFPGGWGGGKVISCGIVLHQTGMGRKS